MPVQRYRSILLKATMAITLPLTTLRVLQDCALAAPPADSPTVLARTIDLELRTDGLYPRQLTLKEGHYEITLRNTAFLAAVDFAVRAGTSTTQKSRPTTGTSLAGSPHDGKFRWRQAAPIVLAPGKYYVQIVGQPNWVMDITVIAQDK